MSVARHFDECLLYLFDGCQMFVLVVMSFIIVFFPPLQCAMDTKNFRRDTSNKVTM